MDENEDYGWNMSFHPVGLVLPLAPLSVILTLFFAALYLIPGHLVVYMSGLAMFVLWQEDDTSPAARSPTLDPSTANVAAAA